MGLAIPRLASFAPDDVDRFIFQVKNDLVQGERAMFTALMFTKGKLSGLAPTSREYALAVAAFAIEGQSVFRDQWSALMRIVSEIRPPSTGGRFKRTAPPAKFGDQWPHERLGHPTWTSFVEAPPHGKRKNSREYEVPPGLGLSSNYEKNLFKGWQHLGALVDVAMPEATPEEKDQVKDRVVSGAGPAKIALIGSKKVTPGGDFSPEQASAVVDHLIAGGPAKADLEERGAAALTDPRPLGRRAAKVAAAPPAEAPVVAAPPAVEAAHSGKRVAPVLEALAPHDGGAVPTWGSEPMSSVEQLQRLVHELRGEEIDDAIKAITAILNTRSTA